VIDDRYTAADLRGTLRALAVRWRWLLEPLTPAERAAVEPILLATAEAVGSPSSELDAIAAAAECLPPDRQRDVVERTEELLSAAGRAAPIAPQSGTVVGVFASDGGVPKLPIDRAVVGRRGVAGDRQAARKHHGRVSQALCIWSAEVVEALADEGHPIGPGRAGENVLVRGLEWSLMRPGVRLQLGPVLAELTGFALPCKKNAPWFSGGDFHRMDPDRQPGWSRAYASVVVGGELAVGDPVTAG
jgi:MOSC domain-containing protein YiiM